MYEVVLDTKYALLYGIVLVFCSLLCPILWTTWINHLSGNANFYYALGLVFQVCQIMFMGDMMGSVLKLDFLDKPGNRERAESDAKDESATAATAR
jgi:GPI-anchor transamidase subunit U